MKTFFNFVAADFFKKESRSPRGFLPRPLLRAGESVAPPPLPQKNSGGAHHFRFRFLDLCIIFGKIISKVCEWFNSGASSKLRSVLEKFFCATRSGAHCFSGGSSTFLFCKVRFEPKIFWRDDFLEGRSSFFATSSSNEASFIRSRIGSSHGIPPLCDLAITSSTDFFSDISPRFRIT